MNTRNIIGSRLTKVPTSTSVASRMTGSVVSSFQPGAGTQLQPNTRTKTVSTPSSMPYAGQNIPDGRQTPDVVVITLDRFSTAPTTAAKTTLKLFDAHQFLASVGLDVTNPANSVYMGDTTNNGYPFLINTMCRYDYVVESMLVNVEVNTTSVTSAETQLNEFISIINGDIDQQYETDKIRLGDFVDLDAFTQKARLIPLQGKKGLITNATSWKVGVWNGCRVNLSLFLRARVIQ